MLWGNDNILPSNLLFYTMSLIPKFLISKSFRKVDITEAQRLADILDNTGNKQGKNYKDMRDEHDDKGELRGRDWIRVVYDKVSKEVIDVFKKTGHDTTDKFM